MEEVKKALDEAYMVLSSLSVSGDAIDIMATVRSLLREAISILKKEGENG